MTISWIQAVILGIFACLASMPGMGGSAIGNYTLGRPLVAGLVCGIILGNVPAGIMVGAAMQVVYIALVTPGGTVSADVRAVSYIGIPLAMLALNSYGLDPASTKGVAMATSFGAMVGTLGTVLFYGTATINLVWQHIGWRAVEKGEFKKLYLVDMVLPWISHLICSFIPTVVMCKLGVPVVETIKATLPMDGLAMKTLFTVGSMLPCVGHSFKTGSKQSNRLRTILCWIYFSSWCWIKLSIRYSCSRNVRNYPLQHQDGWNSCKRSSSCQRRVF